MFIHMVAPFSFGWVLKGCGVEMLVTMVFPQSKWQRYNNNDLFSESRRDKILLNWVCREYILCSFFIASCSFYGWEKIAEGNLK